MKVLTAEQIKYTESRAVLEAGIPLVRLMDNAGSAAARVIRTLSDVSGIKCVVVCGNGNNGGDGFVVARKLFEAGADVAIVLTSGVPKSSDSQSMLDRTNLLNIPVYNAETRLIEVGTLISSAQLIVDAIFGIGFRDEVGGLDEKLIDLINVCRAKIYSLDVPSGIHANDGTVGGKCVKADCTITFTSPKPAHINVKAVALCGRIEVVDIGIPHQLLDEIKTDIELIDTASVKRLLPRRRFDSHKGDYGRLLALCGSYTMPGAAVLSVKAAIRSGVGLAELAVTDRAFPVIAPQIPESIYLPLPPKNCKSIDFDASVPLIEKSVSKATCILIGCGLSTDESCVSLVRYVMENAQCPIVLDADGINILAENIDILQKVSSPVVITPHPGEMSRLTNLPVAAIQSNRYRVALETASRLGVITVLKGAYTVLASPEGRCMCNASGNGGMASAGVGDVLAGIISALIAEGIDPCDAAMCGVHLHSLAGDRCAEKYSQYGMTAGDLVRELPLFYKELGR